MQKHTILGNLEAYKTNFVGNLDKIIPCTMIMPLKFTLLQHYVVSPKCSRYSVA